MARTDGARGAWKAPAGIRTYLRDMAGLGHKCPHREKGILNPRAVENRGTLTVDGDDLNSEYKYIPVRRPSLYLEASPYRGTKWAVFEPNDTPLRHRSA